MLEGTLCETWYPGGMKRADRKGYPTDVSDEEQSFAAPHLTLMAVTAPPRKYELRDMFDALRWMARAGAPWRMLPNESRRGSPLRWTPDQRVEAGPAPRRRTKRSAYCGIIAIA